jgi:hypothetical protein
LDALPIKIPKSTFIAIEKSVQMFIWNHKRPQRAKVILSKWNNAGGVTTPDLDYTTEP